MKKLCISAVSLIVSCNIFYISNASLEPLSLEFFSKIMYFLGGNLEHYAFVNILPCILKKMKVF